MKKYLFLYLLVALVSIGSSFGQDTLPNFTVVERGEKVTVSWVNPYPNVIQLNVQRSFDSIRFFTTVFSAESPQLPQNGFTEIKMPTNRIFYRIFYVLENGSYFFTPSKRVGLTPPPTATAAGRDIKNPAFSNISSTDKRLVTVRIKDSVYRQIPAYNFRHFRDSVLRQTKDTLLAINDSLVLLKPFFAKEVWRPSLYVYSNREGYINIALPLFRDRKYRIKFFEEDGRPLFEIRHVRESPLILDKANFIHSGWFHFELYEDDKLKEKNKFYLPKDF
ncbi:hypothetical protein [Aridibaculum aurantiacum]|uniref:hypothetical protein n=1 Tax=Aridibaculum aurantiacum TaxID=2810307 RepID=UPI001A96B8E6|nr:hypothetical protein [Aridibaculum aurantiacum]